MQEGTLASPKSAILTGRPMKMAFAMQQVQVKTPRRLFVIFSTLARTRPARYATKIEAKGRSMSGAVSISWSCVKFEYKE